MDGRRSHALSDEALDGELRAALAIDHSPEFLARVRTRIAAEPAVAPWRTSWLSFAAPVLVIVTIALVVWLQPADVQPTARLSAHDVALMTPPLASLAADAPRAIDIAPRVERRAATTSPAHEAAQRPREPEVLISRGEQRAFAQLVRMIDEGRLSSDAVTTDGASPDEGVQAIDVAPIEAVAPIRIEPLDNSRRLE